MAAKEMNTSSFEVKSLGFSYPTRAPHRSFFMTQVIFRVLAVAFTVASISVMVTSDQNVLVLGVRTRARYSYSSAFKFLVGADAVVSGFSVLSLIFVCLGSRPTAQFMNCFYLFLHDMAMMVLLISGCSAATAIGYVGRHGAKQMTWVPVCDYVGKFCNQVMASLALSYLAFLCYLALVNFSAYKLMTRPTD